MKTALPEEIRRFYLAEGPMTALGGEAAVVAALPRDLGELCRIIQGVLLHEHWAPAYDATPSAERRAESQIRPVQRMLAEIRRRDARPLAAPRAPAERLVGVCRHFALLLCAVLRRQGVPARARCGFGAYFTPGRFEDHWVCEYWSDAAARWTLVDAQIDALQRARLKPDFDLLDIPRDRFIPAGDAWKRCRAGPDDPDCVDANLFGIFDIRGLFFVAGNVLRDLAALNNLEMLPWDIWGAMFRADEAASAEQLALFDRLAALTLEPGEAFGELRALYEADARLRVPPRVFNAVRNAAEMV